MSLAWPINDLGYLENTVPNLVNISTCKYADDCTQYQIVIERGMCSPMQEAVDGLSGSINKLTLNPKKPTKDICGFVSQTQS